jgi:hypothetical protein
MLKLTIKEFKMKELKDYYLNKFRPTDFDVSQFNGVTFQDVYFDPDGDFILFKVSDNEIYQMYHYQECCEHVELDDIVGDVSDLIKCKVIHFEERTNGNDTEHGSETWTFYDIQTEKGSINLKWHGDSNGHYSESVNLVRLK